MIRCYKYRAWPASRADADRLHSQMLDEQLPEAAYYLREHLKFDDERRTVTYTGDDRFQVDPVWRR